MSTVLFMRQLECLGGPHDGQRHVVGLTEASVLLDHPFTPGRFERYRRLDLHRPFLTAIGTIETQVRPVLKWDPNGAAVMPEPDGA